MYETFIDLDELIVRCRDKASRQFIQEAVACYRAGAFRSCIVATWNAVVFDFLHKLRELEIVENGEAKKILKEFENLRKSGENKYKELWDFGSRIPDICVGTDFELISPVEKFDIERLFQDRSRCAHPSMISLEEPFEATAELARYHLRSAVTHLLQRPPVQGRAVRDRIFQDIRSIYFPKDPNQAEEHFKNGLLARARPTLINDIIIGLTTSLLTEDRLDDERERQFSALIATSRIYPKETKEKLNSKLSEIILSKVNDENLDKAIIYLSRIDAWDSLDKPCEIKLKSYIDSIDVFDRENSQKLLQKSLLILTKASQIEFLRECVIQRLCISLDFKQLFRLNEDCNDDFFKEKILIHAFKELAPKANLNDLLRMRSDAMLKSDNNIEEIIKSKIKDWPLSGLIRVASKHQDPRIIEFIEADLKTKVDATCLQDLLVAKSDYLRNSAEPRNSIIALLDKGISENVRDSSFEDLLELFNYFEYFDEISVQILESILKENIDKIIKRFIKSGNWFNSEKYTSLLIRVVENLTENQWETIFEAFFQNDQVYGSWGCITELETLFEKSLEITGSVPSYWISFGEKLPEYNDQNSNQLKRLIESHLS